MGEQREKMKLSTPSWAREGAARSHEFVLAACSRLETEGFFRKKIVPKVGRASWSVVTLMGCSFCQPSIADIEKDLSKRGGAPLTVERVGSRCLKGYFTFGTLELELGLCPKTLHFSRWNSQVRVVVVWLTPLGCCKKILHYVRCTKTVQIHGINCSPQFEFRPNLMDCCPQKGGFLAQKPDSSLRTLSKFPIVKNTSWRFDPKAPLEMMRWQKKSWFFLTHNEPNLVGCLFSQVGRTNGMNFQFEVMLTSQHLHLCPGLAGHAKAPGECIL